MDKTEIQKKLSDIIAKHASVSPSAITAEKHMKSDLGLDSLDVAEMVFEIEEQFGVAISDDSAQSIQKVGDAVDFIHRNMAGSRK